MILSDDLILGTPGALSEMVDAYAASETGHMVATMQVALKYTRKYGMLSVTGRSGRPIHADGMVEKPAPKDAPSRHAVAGRYNVDARIFDALEKCPPGAGAEIQLTDAIAKGIGEVGLCGINFSGTRFDCGSKAGMPEAILHVSANDPGYANVLEAVRSRTPRFVSDAAA